MSLVWCICYNWWKSIETLLLKLQFTWGFILWGIHSMSFDKCVMKYIQICQKSCVNTYTIFNYLSEREMKRQFDRVRNHNSIFSSWKTILERTLLFRNKNAQFLSNVVSIHIFVYLQHNIFIYCMRANPLQSCPTLCDPWTVACQASLSMGFSRQEY